MKFNKANMTSTLIFASLLLLFSNTSIAQSIEDDQLEELLTKCDGVAVAQMMNFYLALSISDIQNPISKAEKEKLASKTAHTIYGWYQLCVEMERDKMKKD